MIPHISQPFVRIGPIVIYAWAALVVVGMAVSVAIFLVRARRAGLDSKLAIRLALWVLLAGIVGAHLVNRLVYAPGATLAHPVSLVLLWQGMSSIGGLLGGIIGAVVVLRRARLGAAMNWRAIDAMAYALPFGWLIGRVGCFLAFDHPGRMTRSILGQRDAYGILRHNLGLEEAVLLVGIAVGVGVFGRRELAPGRLAGGVAVSYGVVRLGLDSLRVADARYAGLTPAQWGALGLVVLGVGVLWGRRESR